mmetsp:Transcript_21088/g.31218  ORF Transcript_21088/g.31218 Transcript_21088/m.31218 type:complete len:181 (-) Transcript_21088:129-671(-)
MALITRNKGQIVFLALFLNSVSAFSPAIPTQSRILEPFACATSLRMSVDDDISRQLAISKKILEKAKAKIALEESGGASVKVKKEKSSVDKKTSVLKSNNEETGLSTFDGDLMASLSEEEDWELKGMFDVFDNEIEESDVAKSLAKRDVAASIVNMRISMHNEDYRKIFDSRNRWIGEDN